MINHSRRHFFNNFVENSVQLLVKAYSNFKIDAEETDDNYFSSYESAYTLISENLPFIDEEVERLKIDTEGKSKLEIVKEIYEKTHLKV